LRPELARRHLVIADPFAPRLLCFHKQGTSARTRFVRWPHGMLAFAPLPVDAIAVIAEFEAALATPQGEIPVQLIQFTTQDPPFAAVEALGGKFIAITEARDVVPAELQLLRQAYEILIG
jgi:hypothetical protein